MSSPLFRCFFYLLISSPSLTRFVAPKPRPSRLFCPFFNRNPGAMHPLALAKSGWVWVGAGSRPAGLRTGRAIPRLRRDAALPVRQNTRQGREGFYLPDLLQYSRRTAVLWMGRGVRPYFCSIGSSRSSSIALSRASCSSQAVGFGHHAFGREKMLRSIDNFLTGRTWIIPILIIVLLAFGDWVFNGLGSGSHLIIWMIA
jgi:hypothetical protein